MDENAPDKMTSVTSQRYYSSVQYLLPADREETARFVCNNSYFTYLLTMYHRLDAQHLIIVKAFENRLSLAPLNLVAGDKVLESAAGSGTAILAHSQYWFLLFA